MQDRKQTGFPECSVEKSYRRAVMPCVRIDPIEPLLDDRVYRSVNTMGKCFVRNTEKLIYLISEPRSKPEADAAAASPM
jgi:hypothetical protein